VLTVAAVVSKVEEWQKLRREAKLEAAADRKGLRDERERLDLEVQNLVDLGASDPAPAIKRGIDERTARIAEIDGQLKAAEVLHEFDIRTIRDAVQGVMEDWQQQLDRNPDLIGQVLGKVVAVKMKLTPQHGGKAWDLAAEVDYAGILREADADFTEAVESLLRELEIRSAGAGRAFLPSPFAADGLPHDGPRPRPRSRASISAKAPWRTCWRRSGSRR
jgi:hypothetical protein